MRRAEAVDLVPVLGRQDRASGIDEPAAGLYERRGLLQHDRLLLDARREHLRLQPPFRVGPPPPHAGAGARRIDQHEIHLAGKLGEAFRLGGGEHLRVADAGALQPLEDRTQAHAVGIVGIELAGVLHRCRQRERLAARTGAKIEHLLPRLGAGKHDRDLRGLVLHLEPALAVSRLRLDMGTARRPRALRDAHAERRVRRGLGVKAAQRL